VVFVESKWFTRRLRELAREEADDVLGAIQTDLLASPARGKVVPGLGRNKKGKMRKPTPGKSKRGGYRYLYLFLAQKDHVHLLFLLDKDEQEDLSSEERAILRRLVAEISQG
jgi:hypothetical protein